jgi:hypothetical protein
MNMNFENWYSKMLSETTETQASPATDIKPKTDAIANVPSREDIISDVDSIMTQLDQLSAQVKEDFDIEILDESLVLEGAWDDTKDNFGSLFGDPVFQLVGLGIAGIIGALGLSVKAVKDTKRNGAIGKMVMGDYAKLKQLKLQEVKLEAIQHQLEEKKDDIEAANESIIDEANPAAKKPAQKPAQKPQAGPNAQARQTAIADKEKALKAKEAEAKKNAATAGKTTSSDENDARDKMSEKIEAQIQAIIKKRDVLDSSITTYESTLDAKYAEEKITGFGSKKVHTLIASAKDGVAQEVAEAKLKFFSETLSDEALKELKESLDAINQRQAKRTADINKEAEENAAKAKEVAAEDEDVKAALDKIKNPNADDEEEPETEEEPTSNDGGGDSDAVKALKKQKEEDDEKKRQERAANKEDDTKNAEKEATKNTKDGMLDRLDNLMKKAKESGDEEKIKKIQNQIDKISAKENWQLDNTELGRLFEMEISKIESEFKLFESKNQIFSIANKFKLLMG